MDSSTELERELAATRKRMAAEIDALTARLDVRTQLRHRYDDVVQGYPWVVLAAGLLGGFLVGRLVFRRRG